MNRRIFLLVDYRGQFYFSTKYRGASVDILKLKEYFEGLGIQLIVKKISEINFRNENFKDELVLYQSSEDPGLFYKDYIEDVLVALALQGARLIPEFRYFRAHHNKIFQEFLRDILSIVEIKNIESRAFGTYEEYIESNSLATSSKLVLKPGGGTRSSGVSLLATSHQKIIFPYYISKTFTLANLKLLISKIKTGKPFTPMSSNRRKFIIQNFIEGLEGDFRILVYGKKFYVVFRGNRDGDFRASGSGKLNFEIDPPRGLLNFAESVYVQLETPYVSLDIGHTNGVFYLFEFQCLCLGQYTIEKSKFYYTRKGDDWEKISEIPDLEREIATSVFSYISGE